jgi:hypothetical protein
MKLFLKVTAVFEGLTGLALIFAPQLVIQMLFLSSLEETGGIIIARIGGAAILIIALLCWMTKEIFLLLIKLLLIYNIFVILITLYSLWDYGIQRSGLVIILLFHFVFAIWGFIVSRKYQKNIRN